MARPVIVPGEEELGPQIICTKCGMAWPADDEFWYPNHGRWHPWCKACLREARELRWARKQGIDPNARAVSLAR